MNRAARRWYALLLGLCPVDFRREFGREVLRVIGEQHADVSARRGAAHLHLATSMDLLRAALTQRATQLARVASALLMLAALANVSFDLLRPDLSMGYLAWGLTVLAMGASLAIAAGPARRRRPG